MTPTWFSRGHKIKPHFRHSPVFGPAWRSRWIERCVNNWCISRVSVAKLEDTNDVVSPEWTQVVDLRTNIGLSLILVSNKEVIFLHNFGVWRLCCYGVYTYIDLHTLIGNTQFSWTETFEHRDADAHMFQISASHLRIASDSCAFLPLGRSVKVFMGLIYCVVDRDSFSHWLLLYAHNWKIALLRIGERNISTV